MIKPNLRLVKVSIHDKDVGVGILPAKDNSKEDRERRRNIILNRTMHALGFKSKKEYMNLYPGKYRYNSELISKLNLEKWTLDPEPEYGLMEDPHVFQASVFAVSDTIDEIIQECEISIITSRNSGGKLGSMTLFPKLKDFKEYADKANPENRLDQLWFCLDWKES